MDLSFFNSIGQLFKIDTLPNHASIHTNLYNKNSDCSNSINSSKDSLAEPNKINPEIAGSIF